jgi:hypothetical protein
MPVVHGCWKVTSLADSPALHHLHRGVPRLLDARVRVDDQLVLAVVVALVQLGEDRVEHVGRGVHEVRAGLGRLELLARLDERVPRGPQLRHLRAVGRQARLREQVTAVAHAQATDVGAEPDLVLAVPGQRLLPLPRQPAVLELVRPEVQQVDEVLGLAAELDDEVLVDRLDVRRAAAGREVLAELLVVLVVLALAFGDLDVRMGLLVGGNQALEAEVAEVVDRELDVPVGLGRRAGVARAGRAGQE